MEYVLKYIRYEKRYYKFFVLTEETNIRACKVYQKYADKEELGEYTYSERFEVYLIKHKEQAFLYNKNDNIIKDSYSNKYFEFM